MTFFSISEETVNPRQSVVTELQLSDISDDVGTCWRELGPKLNIPTAKIRNLDEEYKSNRDKANALLTIWKEQEGSGALTGVLANALESIGRKSIAEKLLGEWVSCVIKVGTLYIQWHLEPTFLLVSIRMPTLTKFELKVCD